MEPLIDPRVAAARARAAIAYAGLEHAEIEKKTGLDVAMIRRITSKANPRDGRIERLWAIADACDVPRGFMEAGWDFAGAQSADDDTRTRLQNIETQLAALVEGVTHLEDRTRQLERDAQDRDKDDLERELEAAAQQDATRRGSTSGTGRNPDARAR